jgi:rhodanese-related sulfurtransferase
VSRVKVDRQVGSAIGSALLVVVTLVGCAGLRTATVDAPGQDAPYPATWTPAVVVESTPTATLVIRPTPTWDGSLPPPSKDHVPRISPAELQRAVENREPLTIVDVRPFAAFRQARLPSAVDIPVGELAGRVGELDGNKTIVFYDLLLSEDMSLEAAMTLYEVGFTKIAVLEGGIQRWYLEGYAIEGDLVIPTPGEVDLPWVVTPLPTSTPLIAATRSPTPTPTADVPTATPTGEAGTATSTPTPTG